MRRLTQFPVKPQAGGSLQQNQPTQLAEVHPRPFKMEYALFANRLPA
jgi:hypothetical protein